jgi:ATP synthase protein I
MSSIKAPPIYKVTAYQLLLTVLLTAILLILSGWISAYSLLIGGLISALPGAFFASRVFKYRGARAAHKIVRELYVGELVKLVLIGAGFALSFYYVNPLNVVALFSGFILVHVTGLVFLARVIGTGNNRQ